MTTPDLAEIIKSLEAKGYIKRVEGKYNPVAGNMSFEVFKFLDPDTISITLVASDAHRLGVVQDGQPRRITPREAARLQGYPDTFRLHPDDKVAYRQLGNAVAVPIIEILLNDLLVNNKLRCVDGFVKTAKIKSPPRAVTIDGVGLDAVRAKA